MRINREKFLRSLESVQPGLSSREIIEQSSCLVFSKGEVITFNDEISCRMPTDLDRKFTGVLQAKNLMELLKKMTEDEIDLELTETLMTLHGKRKTARFPLDKDIVLPISIVDPPTEWIPLHRDFCEAIDTVRKCASQDNKKFEATCVHIQKDWVEAFDDAQLCRWTLSTKIKKPALVRASSIKHVTDLGVVEFCDSDSWIHFKNPNKLIFSCRRYTDDFPDLSKALEVKGEKAILPKGLIEASSRAGIFSAENPDADRVLVDLEDGNIKVSGIGITSEYQETRKVKYSGEPISFMIAPKLLATIVEQYPECEITHNRLKVDGGNFIYVSCLRKPKSNGAKK